MHENLLDTSGIAFIGIYLASLLAIGWLANRARKENSLKDYYLAGSSLGSVSLFFTLYATQYSGNTLFAIPGNAYRNGFVGLNVAAAVMFIVVVYFLFAGRLNELAKKHGFVSVGDFITWRYDHKPLLIAVNIIGIITLVSYALGNFKAIGLLMETATGGIIPFAMGIIILGFVMAVYESLGGLRGVIWTDIIQGTLLFLGCILLFFAVLQLGPANGSQALTDGFTKYFSSGFQPASFFSVVFLVGIGAAVYPQAVQRIYIAKDARTLQRSYYALFFMPLLTTVPMILVGVMVADWIPGLDAQQSENVVIFAVGEIAQAYPAVSWLLILYLGAAVAAIMSTIDSALLSLGSTIIKDFWANRDNSREVDLHRASRTTSWVLMAVIATLAIVLPQTIWALMIFKFELLIQIAPAIIIGVRNPTVSSQSVLFGLIVGCAVAVLLKLSGYTSYNISAPLGIHAGLWGLGANLFGVVLWRK
ncbi:MAG: sodium:solute symporter family protein [Kordiimonadaceae bacterium]|nr:sodium:solute symporter family protein [Kordiimonadaceae bacterium]MBO6567152.1 sodium:solute symporter family protein [Kordiimonadaceae bacterium]MBO6963633.1 sodium:solute symporter family protein [Kordiimonadaceae bacterium]